MSNKELAKEILRKIGGETNVVTATHCATRLRVIVKDESKASVDILNEIPDVIKAQYSNGQLQVVLGGKVEGVYNEFKTLLPDSASSNEIKTKKKLGFGSLIETVAGIFSPTLPVLIGCGMIQSATALLLAMGLIEAGTGVHTLLKLTGDIIFYFLPFFLAVSAARKFKTSEFLALALAGAFMYPIIQNGALQAAETGIKALDVLGLPILFVNYKSTVFPIIISVWILSYVYKGLNKIIPDSLKILFVPMLTLFIMVPLSLGILGPIGSYIGIYIAEGVKWLYSTGGVIGSFLLGAFRPVLVMFGMHYAITPIMVQEIAETGFTVIIPALLVGNLAQSGAAFATAFLLRDKTQKTGAFSAAFTAFLGITEPAMYGYNLKYKKPFYAALFSAGIAAAYMSIFHAKANAVALPGILALSTYSADSFIHIIIGVLIAVIGAFVLTIVLGIQQDPKKTSVQNTEETKEVIEVISPMEGEIIELQEIDDDVFSNKLMGDGFAIIPSNGKVVAPVDGTITLLFETLHAIGITTEQGAEILIHIGLDTVELKGEPFTPHIKVGDKVKQGDLIMDVDLDKIKAANKSVMTPVIFTNHFPFKLKK